MGFFSKKKAKKIVTSVFETSKKAAVATGKFAVSVPEKARKARDLRDRRELERIRSETKRLQQRNKLEVERLKLHRAHEKLRKQKGDLSNSGSSLFPQVL